MYDYIVRVMGAGFLVLGVILGRVNNCYIEDDKKLVFFSYGLVSLIYCYFVYE